MKMKDCFDIVEIGDDYMAVPVGSAMETFGGTVILNDVSAFLLNNMTTDKTEEDLIALLCSEYNVDEVTAATDISMIIKTFDEIGLIEN